MKLTRACVLLFLALVGGIVLAATRKAEGLAGKVVETMNAANYSYVLLDTCKEKVWAAAAQFQVKVGDAVAVVNPVPMSNYRSKTLNRTFDLVYFCSAVSVNGAALPAPGGAEGLPAGHPPTAGAKGPGAINLSGIARAAQGQTVAEIHAGKAKLAGQPIAVRGRVVKFNAMILGKNWLHVRDGSGAEGTNDLTVTTAATAKVGDLVLVRGVLRQDRDFGSGYKYGLIVEDANVVVE